jgi:hypothetical protein
MFPPADAAKTPICRGLVVTPANGELPSTGSDHNS